MQFVATDGVYNMLPAGVTISIPPIFSSMISAHCKALGVVTDDFPMAGFLCVARISTGLLVGIKRTLKSLGSRDRTSVTSNFMDGGTSPSRSKVQM